VKIGRVAGTVVATISSPVFDARRLLLVDILDDTTKASGAYLIAVDAVDAGAGEIVLVLDEGNSARQVLDAPEAPVRAVIVGIVDELVIDGRELL
jgi:microcompartment protein CcmK/EutM